MLQYEKEKNKAMEFKLKCDNIMENNLRLKTELEASISEKQNLEFQVCYITALVLLFFLYKKIINHFIKLN